MIGCDLHSKLATLKINFVTNMCMEFPFRYYALSKAISSKLSSYVDRRDKIDHHVEIKQQMKKGQVLPYQLCAGAGEM